MLKVERVDWLSRMNATSRWGGSPVRQAAYRGLFKTHLDAERVDEICLAWQSGTTWQRPLW
jgi:hypothetical protein